MPHGTKHPFQSTCLMRINKGFPEFLVMAGFPWLGPRLNERFWGSLIEWPLFFFSCSLSGPVGGDGPADKTEITLIREDGQNI